jgi:hypothetical protein
MKADEKKKSNGAPLSIESQNIKADNIRPKLRCKYQKQTRESTRYICT